MERKELHFSPRFERRGMYIILTVFGLPFSRRVVNLCCGQTFNCTYSVV